MPSEAERARRSGGEAELRRALELEPGRADAAVPLARILAGRGERDEALELLGRRRAARSPPTAWPPACGSSRTTRSSQGAFAALDDGESERGLDLLIGAIPAAEDAERRDDLRRAVVGVLDELGVEHPLARESRRKLAVGALLDVERELAEHAAAPAGAAAPTRPRSEAIRTPISRTGCGGA